MKEKEQKLTLTPGRSTRVKRRNEMETTGPMRKKRLRLPDEAVTYRYRDVINGSNTWRPLIGWWKIVVAAHTTTAHGAIKGTLMNLSRSLD